MRFTPLVRNAKYSQTLSQRVRRPAYLQRLARAEDLPPLFQDGDYVCISLAIDFCSFPLQIGWSGFTGVGYPKLVPTVRFYSTLVYLVQYRVQAIADHIESHNLQAEPSTKKKFNLFVGASVGPEIEDRWARLDMIARRYPHQVGKEIARGINAGRINFADKHLSSLSVSLSFIFLVTVV